MHKNFVFLAIDRVTAYKRFDTTYWNCRSFLFHSEIACYSFKMIWGRAKCRWIHFTITLPAVYWTKIKKNSITLENSFSTILHFTSTHLQKTFTCKHYWKKKEIVFRSKKWWFFFLFSSFTKIFSNQLPAKKKNNKTS